MAECNAPCTLPPQASGCTAGTADLGNAKIIFLVGGPGSGKGTQSELIVKKFGYNHLSTGDMLRAEIESCSPRSMSLKAIMDKGELVPTETVLELVKEAMQHSASPGKPYLIDGYPRELEQGKLFETNIAPVETVLYFEVSDEVMKERIKKRGESSGRSDDNDATVVKRIATFHKANKPLVDYYAKQNKLVTIDANCSVDEIFAKVAVALKQKSGATC